MSVAEDTMTSKGLRSAGRALGIALALAVAACNGERSRSEVREAATGATCSPEAAHPHHAAYACTTCHACSGVVSFDPAGAAVAAGQPPPAFDAATRTCTSVACHGVAPGTFSYYFPDGSGEPELRTVSYGGGGLRATPSWLSTAGTCDACHDNPPRTGAWHSGLHAGQGPTGAANQCQFCHPDASGANGVGTAITNAALHGNRRVDVSAAFTRRCFGCH